MCPKYWRVPSRVLLFSVLVFLSIGSLRAQNLTEPAPSPSSTKPSSVLISTDSLLTLWQKLLDSRQSLTEAQKQAETAQQRAEAAQSKAESLSAQLDQQQQDSTELSKSLAASLSKAALADQATKDREALDQKAIDEAKSQNWLYAVGGVLATVGVLKGYDFVIWLLKR